MAKFYGDLVLINQKGYSNTTRTHKGLVRNALHTKYIEVPNVTGLSPARHKENIKFLVDEGVEAVKAASRARLEWSIAHSRATAHQALANAILYAQHFGLAYKRLTKPLALLVDADPAEVKALDKKVRKAEQDRLERKNRKAIKEWEAHERNGYLHSIDRIYLRLSLDGQKVETSHGAQVDIKEANTLFKLWRKGKNIRGAKIGYFTVTKATPKLVTIGCHPLRADTLIKFFK